MRSSWRRKRKRSENAKTRRVSETLRVLCLWEETFQPHAVGGIALPFWEISFQSANGVRRVFAVRALADDLLVL
ncbi:hypothetical protein ANRL1_02533 [Anaerolineae bacterium]|nr:hypothetical protein ANRL1_02533 [Anaerolineae bacterium]